MSFKIFGIEIWVFTNCGEDYQFFSYSPAKTMIICVYAENNDLRTWFASGEASVAEMQTLQVIQTLTLSVSELKASSSGTLISQLSSFYKKPYCHFQSRRKPHLSLSCSVSNSDGRASTTSAAGLDASLALKKKATEIVPVLKGTSIFLVGMNSSIKTHLGKRLAEVLRYYYFDSDHLVEEAAGGESAAKLFRKNDEDGFRQSETEVFKQLSSLGRLVVCAGDGAVQSSTNLGLLRHGISIWIDVPLDMIASEAVEGQSQLSDSESDSKVLNQLTSSYQDLRDGYATADATISLQKVASKLGYDDLNCITTEDITLEGCQRSSKNVTFTSNFTYGYNMLYLPLYLNIDVTSPSSEVVGAPIRSSIVSLESLVRLPTELLEL